jgi:DNA-binding beta-propeller fold protein YncE
MRGAPENSKRSASLARRDSGRALRHFLSCAIVGLTVLSAALLVNVESASATLGANLRTLTPSPSGNGRAVAFDPSTGRLFYTNSGDPHIYVIDTSGNLIATLNTGVTYGALTWDPSDGVLWGGRYDGTGRVDQINPVTGAVTPKFQFPYPVVIRATGQRLGTLMALRSTQVMGRSGPATTMRAPCSTSKLMGLKLAVSPFRTACATLASP